MRLLLAQMGDAGGIASMCRRFNLQGDSASFDTADVEQHDMQLPMPARPLVGSSLGGAVTWPGAVATSPHTLAVDLEGASQFVDSRHEQQHQQLLGLRISTQPQGVIERGPHHAGQLPAAAPAERGTPRRHQPIVWQPPPAAADSQCAPRSLDAQRRLSARFLRFHCQPGAAAMPSGHAMGPPSSHFSHPNRSAQPAPFNCTLYRCGDGAAPLIAPAHHVPPLPPGYDGVNGHYFAAGQIVVAAAGPPMFPGASPELPPGYDGSLAAAPAAAPAVGRSAIELPGAVGLRAKAQLPCEPASIELQQQQPPQEPSAGLPTSPLSPAHVAPSLWAANGLLPLLVPAGAGVEPSAPPASSMSPVEPQLLFQQAHMAAAAAQHHEGAFQALPSSLPAAQGFAQGHSHLPSAVPGLNAAPLAMHPAAFGQVDFAARQPVCTSSRPSVAASGQPPHLVRGGWQHTIPFPGLAAGQSTAPIREATPAMSALAAPHARHFSRHERRRSRSRSRSRSVSRGRRRRASPLRRTHHSPQRQHATRDREDGGREPSRGRSKRRRLRSKSRRRSSSPERQPPRPALAVPPTRETTPDVAPSQMAGLPRSRSRSPAGVGPQRTALPELGPPAASQGGCSVDACWDPILRAEAQMVQRLLIRGPMPVESIGPLVDLPPQMGKPGAGERCWHTLGCCLMGVGTKPAITS